MTRRLIILLLALTIPLAAGCGGDDGGGGGGGSGPAGGPAALVAAAIKASEDTESYRMSFDMKSDLENEVFSMDGEAVSAADSSRGWFKGRFEQGGESFDMEFISIGSDQYFRGGPFEEMIPKGKDWVHMSDPTAVRTMTPSEFLEFLRESQDIAEVGREDVRGEPSVHLRGPVNVMELAEKTDSEMAKQFAKIPKASEMKMLIDVWVAEENDQMNRMKLKMSHPDASGSMEIAGDILEYDVSLDRAKEPPGDEVAEASDLGAGG